MKHKLRNFVYEAFIDIADLNQLIKCQHKIFFIFVFNLANRGLSQSGR